MRLLRSIWDKILNLFASHGIGQELENISQWLDEHPEVLGWVAEDLKSKELKNTGRQGMSVETVLRAGLLKQYWQVSYEKLSFHLEDSTSCRAFARLEDGQTPKKSALQAAISSIREETWERINHRILADAEAEAIEKARKVRIDSTSTQSNIHEPSDSSLLYDAVRVMGRLLENCQSSWGFTGYHTHTKQAKKLARKIKYSKTDQQKKPLYKKLISITQDNLKSLNCAFSDLKSINPAFDSLRAEASYYKPLIEGIISQTERRVFNDEKVPASEKVFSLFESHTDIIVKGDDIQYGHKLNLASGISGLILDAVIEQGNPADSTRFLPMLERQREIYGRVPRQTVADGSYASLYNLECAKEKGVQDVAFPKKCGLSIEDMVKSHWVYHQLTNFRAGIEGNISCVKRVYGLARCSWKGLAHFKAYIWSGIVAYNLALFTRLRNNPD